MRSSDGGVDVEWGVLAELEALEAVDHERLGGSQIGTQSLVEEQAVTTQALDLTHDGRRRNAEVAGNLTVGGARKQTAEDLTRKIGAAKPIRCGEGL